MAGSSQPAANEQPSRVDFLKFLDFTRKELPEAGEKHLSAFKCIQRATDADWDRVREKLPDKKGWPRTGPDMVSLWESLRRIIWDSIPGWDSISEACLVDATDILLLGIEQVEDAKLANMALHSQKELEIRELPKAEGGPGVSEEQTIFFNQCVPCKIAFPTPEHLARHNLLRHEEKRFVCEQCDARYANVDGLQTHIRVAHRGKGHACPDCAKIFSRPAELKVHLRVHSKERPFKCSHCDATFARKNHCTMHERGVHGAKSFLCVLCNKAFGAKSSLDAHMRCHRDEKDYECPDCAYKTTYSSHLKRHMKIHGGEKDFACNLCKFKTKHKRSLHEHGIRVHTKAYPHVCSRCCAGFITPSQLERHRAKCQE